MLKQVIESWLALIILYSGVVHATDFKDVISRQKLRAGYLNAQTTDLLPRMAQEGFNTALVKFWALNSSPTDNQLAAIENWARLSQQHGLHFVPVINFWGTNEITWMEPESNLVFNQTEYRKTPCPFSEKNYRILIHDRVLQIAALSRRVPVAAVIIDFEMYAADSLVYPSHCLCEKCFSAFLAENFGSVDVPEISKRHEYLSRNNLFVPYRKFFADRIVRLSRQTAEQVSDIAPDFYIGGLRLDSSLSLNINWNRPDHFLYNALIRGFGTEEKKTLVFTEETYQTGYSEYMEKVIEKFRSPDYHAKLMVGIWQDKIPPENLAEQYYHVAQKSGGYWIYSLESLSAKAQMRPLRFEKDEYWHAAKRANAELDLLASDPNYRSPLQLRDFTAPVPPINLGNIDLTQVRPIYDINKSELQQIPVKLRYLNYLVFYAEKGDDIVFEIGFSSKRNSLAPLAETVLLSQNRMPIASDQAYRNNSAKLNAVAEYSGTYFIAVESYGNTAEIKRCSHPYSIQAGRIVRLLVPDWQIHFLKPEGSREVVVKIDTDGIGESVNAVIVNQQGHPVAHRTVARNETITLSGLSSAPEVFRFLIEPTENAYFEDVRINIVSGALPYLSPWREGLVKY